MSITASNRYLAIPAAALAIVASAANSYAAMSLIDGNSSIGLDPSSPAGVYSWKVDGYEQLYKQWFWSRVGSVGTGDREWSIDTLSIPTVTTSGANGATVAYIGSLFNVSVTYTLAGGSPGSGQAVLNEDILIVNTSGSPLSLQFFQYSDFDLGGTAEGDSVLLFPDNSPFELAYQWDGTIGLAEGIVSLNPVAGLGAVGFAPSLYNQLQDGSRTDLNTSVAPLGPGDVEFAFQWDLQLAASGAGSEALISKIKDLNINIVPEPTVASLALLGLLAVLGRRSRSA